MDKPITQQTLDEKFSAIDAYQFDYWCADGPELKKLTLETNASISAEARQLHDDAVIIDTCSFNIEKHNWYLEQAGATALNLTIPWVTDPDKGSALTCLIDVYQAINRSPDKLLLVDSTDDILQAKKQGKTGLIFGAQSCDFVFHADLDASLEVFAKLGLRIMQIAYNQRSFAADGCLSGCNAGITQQGKALIRAMEKAGVTVDLSHVGEQSCLEATDFAAKPPIYSHCNPKALFDHPRCISDEQIKKVAERGGVIGACAFTPTLCDGKQPATIERFIDVICYYADLVGVDYVGIGLDSNAQPGAYNRHAAHGLCATQRPFYEQHGYNAYLMAYEAGYGPACGSTPGLLSVANLPNVTHHLLLRGFSHSEIRKILGENWLRVFRQTWRNG